MALERVEGVDSADVSYETGRAVVGFDPAVTSSAEFIAELERMTGFTAKVTEADMDVSDHKSGTEDSAAMHDHDDDMHEDHAHDERDTASATRSPSAGLNR